MKKNPIQELFEQILNGQGEPSFKQEDILGKMNKKSKADELRENGEPLVVLSLQDNMSDEPWKDVKTVNAEAVCFVAHKGNGEFESGFLGGVTNAEVLALCEVLDELKDRLLKQAAAKAAESLAKKLFGGE